MEEQIQELEDRIGRTVDRLRAIAERRLALETEVRDLRAEVQRQEQAVTDARAEAAEHATNDGEPIDRDVLLTSLRGALHELRAE